MDKKEFTPEINNAYLQEKAGTSTPVWTFLGTVLVITLVVWGYFQSEANNKKYAEWIASPQTGDVYEIKTPESQYTLYKVSGLSGDSILIQMNQYETNKLQGLHDLREKGEAAYSEDIFSYSKSELKSMLDKGEIFSIERKGK